MPAAAATSTLASRFKALRRETGLSQERLAAEAGRSHATAWELEAGRQTNPQGDTLNAFAAAFTRLLGREITAADLLPPPEPATSPAPQRRSA